MLRRVLEGSLVAVVASLVTWALSSPDDPMVVLKSLAAQVLDEAASRLGPLTVGLWILAVGLCAAGLALQVYYMAPRSGQSGWEWSLVTPSLPTTLLGFGTGLGMLAWAGSLARDGSFWSLVFLALFPYSFARWLAGLRYRWIRAVGSI